MNWRAYLLSTLWISLIANQALAQGFGPVLGGKPDPYRSQWGNPPPAASNDGDLGPSPFGKNYVPLGPQAPTVQDPTLGPTRDNATQENSVLEALNLFEPGKIVATVGSQYILAGDIAPMVEQILEPYYEKATTKSQRMALDDQRGQLAAQLTRQLIDTKLMYLEFERQIPKDKLPEVEKKVRTSFDKDFAEAREKVAAAKSPDDLQELLRRDPLLIRLAATMKEKNIETYAALDSVLRGYGTSLDRQIRAYGESRLGRSIIGKGITMNPEITHDEMLRYYDEHKKDFEFPTKARWEILAVLKENSQTRAEAFNALVAMGNEVFFGASFAAVAQRSSQGWNAEKGGLQDWTTKGNLASDVIDTNLFTLPVGKLSPILEDPKGFYILRVIERQEAGVIPFVEAQDKIREKIKSQKRETQYKEFVEKLRKKTPVSCIYDKPEEPANLANRPRPNMGR